MTFKELQDEVIGTRFKEAQRANVKRWINYRLAQIWGAEEWIFRYGTAAVTVTANSAAVTGVPADLGPILQLQRADGTPLDFLEPATFYDRFFNYTPTELPGYFTVVNGAISVAPVSSETNAGYQLVYEKSPTDLVNDSDTPGFPAAYHYVLVHGATQTGLLQENDFTWQFQAQAWEEGIQAMRRNLLASSRGGGTALYQRDPLSYF